jgi:hypothetical protein
MLEGRTVEPSAEAVPAAGDAAAGVDEPPPPPQAARMAVISIVIVHIIGLLILSNLFILFLLGKSNQKILATTTVRYVDLLIDFVSLCSVI